MNDLTDLSINVADPDDIRRKLPEVVQRVSLAQTLLDEAITELDGAQVRASEARATFEGWQRLFASLRAMVPELSTADEDDDDDEPEASKAEGDPTSVDLVVSIINTAGRELRTREVREIASPSGLADDTVSWALWKASSLGRIRKIKRGRYAPLESASGQSELSVSSNGTSPETVQAEETAGVHSR